MMMVMMMSNLMRSKVVADRRQADKLTGLLMLKWRMSRLSLRRDGWAHWPGKADESSGPSANCFRLLATSQVKLAGG